MSFQIYDLKTEYMENPLGLDCQCPRFSWKMKSDEKDARQIRYRITVGTASGAGDMWDSGQVDSDASNGVYYGGQPLEPCTCYYWNVCVWDASGESVVSGEQTFETGLMDSSIQAWEGAQWIGAPYCTLSPDVRGIFGVETEFRLDPGSSRAGVVIGAKVPVALTSRSDSQDVAFLSLAFCAALPKQSF